VRIAVATTSYPRRPGDYAGGFVRDLNVALRALGPSLTTFAPAAHDLREASDDDGGPVVRVGDAADNAALFYGDGMEANLRRGGPLRAWRRLHAYGGALRAAIAAAGPFDAVVAHWLVPTAWWCLAADGPPVVGVCHGGDAHALARPLLGVVAALRLRRLAGVLAVSEAVASVVRRRTGLGSDRVVVRPMGIDGAAFAAASAARRTPGLIAAAGRLHPIKGFDVVVRALAGSSASAGPPPRFVVAGEGPERARLAALAAEHGVRLELPGTLPRDEVRRLFGVAELVVVPSRVLPGGRMEGAPVAALEAAAAGAPVLASATGGLVDLLPSRSLVPPDDVDAWRARLADVRADPVAFVVPDAAARFDRSHTARALMALLAESVAEAARSSGRPSGS
jgi:glycosyltransferase involved in cell wall biosynthesis